MQLLAKEQKGARNECGIFELLTLCTQYGTLTAEVIKMTKNISVRKLRSNLSRVLKDVRTNFDRYVISKRGEPEAIIMCVDDYEGWVETLEIMSDRKAVRDIRKAQKELAKGKACRFEDVFGAKKKAGK